MNQAIFVYATSFAVAAFVLYGAVRYFWRRPSAGSEASFGPPPPEVLVLGRTRVCVGRSLLIVEVEGRRLLLGSTAHHWTSLADLGAARQRHADDSRGIIDAELSRAVEASRHRRGGRKS